jgi:hypothetical protein
MIFDRTSFSIIALYITTLCTMALNITTNTLTGVLVLVVSHKNGNQNTDTLHNDTLHNNTQHNGTQNNSKIS